MKYQRYLHITFRFQLFIQKSIKYSILLFFLNYTSIELHHQFLAIVFYVYIHRDQFLTIVFYVYIHWDDDMILWDMMWFSD